MKRAPKTYAIAFRFPEGGVFAGYYKGALGWAPTLKTALLFDNAEDAQRIIRNGYGAQEQWAYVVPIETNP